MARPEQAAAEAGREQSERVLRVLAAATFIIFFQAFMVAPLLPRLAAVFDVSVETVGLIVPAYLIPYGLATLAYGPLSDRFGRGQIILASSLVFIALTAVTALADSGWSLLGLRLLTGLGASGVVPVALALISDLFPYQERGRPLGWLFGAMAGGMAFGSSAGALLEPFITFRGLFVLVAGCGAVVLLILLRFRPVLGLAPRRAETNYLTVLAGYRGLLQSGRGRRTYGYVLLNALFHSGVYTWLGLYFASRYALGEIGIGLALLGYGVPGFLFGPPVGRAADRWGRGRLLPIGLVIAGASAAGFALPLPLGAVVVLVTTLSLGYDLTQPLLAGIVTDLSSNKGQAMALNVFLLFTGFGLGSLLFGALLGLGLNAALVLFGAVALLAGVLAVPLFRGEVSRAA